MVVSYNTEDFSPSNAPLLELVDISDLGSEAERCESSSLSGGTEVEWNGKTRTRILPQLPHKGLEDNRRRTTRTPEKDRTVRKGREDMLRGLLRGF